jgi:hypothetical protein
MFVKNLMYTIGTCSIISGVIWKLEEPTDNFLWFSRIALAMICIGLGGIIGAMEKEEE